MTIWPIHPDTIVLSDLFSSCPIGEVITAEQMSATLGRDVAKCRHLVYRALARVNEEFGTNFQTVWGTGGYRRAPTSLNPDTGVTARARGRAIHRRASKRMVNTLAKANDIDEATMNRSLREISVLGALEHLGRDQNQPDVVPAGSTSPVSPATVVSAFVKKMGVRPTLA